MKKIKVLLIALLLTIAGAFFTTTYAADQTRTLKAQKERPFDPKSKYQYKVEGQEEGTELLYTVVKIFDDNDRDFSKYTKPIYCLRGGKGFGATDVSELPIEYIQAEKSEMHQNAKEVIEKYNELYGVNLDRNVTIEIKNEDGTINNKEVNIYNAILWILDESYLPKDKVNSENKVVYSSSEYKQELLDKAGVPKDQQKDITDNDLEVIQQLAIWYFANYDEQDLKKKPTVSQATMNPTQFLRIRINEEDEIIETTKANNIDRIYQYFIYGAINNFSAYIKDAESEARTREIKKNEFDKTKTLTITNKDNNYYKIGPVIIKSDGRTGEKAVNSTRIVLYDAQGKLIPKSYSENVIYKVVDQDENEVQTLQAGMKYFIMFNKLFEKGSDLTDSDKYDMSTVTIEMLSYIESTATFMYAEIDKDVKDHNATNQAVVEIDKKENFDKITATKEFDLALRKFITSIKRGNSNLTFETRTPEIDTNTLINGIENSRTGIKEYTATYTHPKNALEVENGDKVTYTIRIYNEGEIEGTATEVTDYLPEGLKLAENSEINSQYGWRTSTNDEKTIITEYLKDKAGIKPFDKDKTTEETGWQKAKEGEGGLYYADLQIECEVVSNASAQEQKLRNIAAITADTGDDRDSVPGDPGRNDYESRTDNSTYKEDDDDYEMLVMKGREFDLSLRKYISSINGEELKGESSRVPQIDTSKLNTTDITTGKTITTATYKHSKEPLTVKKGDLVTYKIRIYNEGKRDGYATRVTDYLPEGLGFLYTVNGDINSDWFLPEGVNASPLYGEKGIYASEKEVLKSEAYKKLLGENVNLADVQVIQGKDVEGDKTLAVTAGGTTGQTEINATGLIKAYKSEKAKQDLWQQSINDENDGLFYQELEITCVVLKENTYQGILTNVAEITAAQDSEGNEIKNVGDDRDSEPNNVYEDGKHIPGTEVDGYTPGEQDDDDFEPLQLKYFDLALRKFITKVDDKEPEKSREPEVDLKTLIEGTYDRNGKLERTATYTHPKDPLLVKNGSVVEYTIRVYNEGSEDGYAYEVSDDIPEGLVYDPDNTTNKEYGWKMYKEVKENEKDVSEEDIIEYNNKKYIETTNAEEATMIRTRYLEKTLIKAFNSEEKKLDYADVKVVFIVDESKNPNKGTAIVNQAQITEDSGDDEDSTTNEWKDEDDEDIEKVRVPIFDLSLLKWVTKTIVTVDGKTTSTETGFKPNTGKTETTGIRDNKEAEPIAKVEVDRKKLNNTVVKFAYKIRVTNEGEIAGYATELTDFIPEGLEFKEEDNKTYGWVKEGDKKVTTRALETVLLQPGESAEVEIVFTWRNGTDNLGLKTNIAEITEDYNEYNTDDIDSTPDNKKDPYEKEQEDDDDFALVILSIKTGKGTSYMLLTTTMLTLLAGGIYLVKKYVLTY